MGGGGGGASFLCVIAVRTMYDSVLLLLTDYCVLHLPCLPPFGNQETGLEIE